MHRVTVSCGGQRRMLNLHQGETAMMGAAPDNDLVAPFPGVSRRHARLEATADGLLVTDLGSKNGLVCEGRRYENVLLDGERQLRVGYALLEVRRASSSDLALGLRMDYEDSRDPLSTSGQETRELEALDDAAAPTAALRLVRRLGGWDRTGTDSTVGGDSWERREGALAEARTTLRADWLAAVRIGAGGEMSTIHWQGPLARPETLSQLEATLACEVPGRCGAAVRTEVDGLFILAAPAGAGAEGSGTGENGVAASQSWLIAAFADDQHPGAWAGELLAFLADRLLPGATRGGGAGHPEEPDTDRAAAVEPLRFPDAMVVGTSPALTRLLEQLRSTVDSDLNVLLTGETGVGKELVAKVIHASGSQADGPFLAVNCAAIPGDLLEANLFGVVAGAATGVDPRPGLFVSADGGCLFLDEIGELPEPLQAKLLRVLQEREVWPVGGERPRRVEVRVIAASNRNLEREMEEGRFRSDLYYRLRGLHFHVPPLRRRREDLPELIHQLVLRAAQKSGKRIPGVTRRALDRLLAYPWPGNVRELIHEIERAVLLVPDGGALDLEHFPDLQRRADRWRERDGRSEEEEGEEDGGEREGHAAPPPDAGGIGVPRSGRTGSRRETGSSGGEGRTSGEDRGFRPLKERLEEVERRAIREALQAAGGVKTRAAELLGITRNGLNLKLKRLGIEGDD